MTELRLLLDAIMKKRKCLEEILLFTQEQNKLLSVNSYKEFGADEFQELMNKKDAFINTVSGIDEGFDSLFDSIKDELSANKGLYAQEIRHLQEAIRNITELGVRIKNLEVKNKNFLEALVKQNKERVSDIQRSRSVLNTYNKSNYQSANTSYFIDRHQ